MENKTVKILGVETSCDETAAAVVTSSRQILSNAVYSQTSEHLAYGGVVPEIASRAHIENIEAIVKQALEDAGTGLAEIDAIAVTAGPGLIGGVIVGLMYAKGLAAATGKPLICVNHLEGHALTCRLTDDIQYPYLLLLVSGGHCQFIIVKSLGEYQIIGETLDDALGEAFDKTAKMLGLGYPGGPVVEELANQGDENRFKFPQPLANVKNCDFSFSGLKTAVLREIESFGALTGQDKKDICASFQKTCGEIIISRLANAIDIYVKQFPDERRFVISGGVAANKYIGTKIKSYLDSREFKFFSPPVKLCTDNAAMIGWAGIERFAAGLINNIGFTPKARWSLENL